jgi:hypothetical protein
VNSELVSNADFAAMVKPSDGEAQRERVPFHTVMWNICPYFRFSMGLRLISPGGTGGTGERPEFLLRRWKNAVVLSILEKSGRGKWRGLGFILE